MAVAVAAPALTSRQAECLALAANDLRPREIAERVHYSERLVRNELDQARDSLGVSTLSGAVAKAFWNGTLVFLETGEPAPAQAG